MKKRLFLVMAVLLVLSVVSAWCAPKEEKMEGGKN
jgi:hypothetical protein